MTRESLERDALPDWSANRGDNVRKEQRAITELRLNLAECHTLAGQLGLRRGSREMREFIRMARMLIADMAVDIELELEGR